MKKLSFLKVENNLVLKFPWYFVFFIVCLTLDPEKIRFTKQFV